MKIIREIIILRVGNKEERTSIKRGEQYMSRLRRGQMYTVKELRKMNISSLKAVIRAELSKTQEEELDRLIAEYYGSVDFGEDEDD